MSNLSPELRELVLASRSASLPTEADSARIFEALRVRLGNVALTGTEAQVAATSVSSGLLLGKGSLIGLAGLAVLGGLWWFAEHNPRIAARETNTAPSIAASISDPIAVGPTGASSSTPGTPAPDTSAVVAGASSATEPEEARAVAKPRARDRLAEEVALLSRAESALHNGRPAAALDVLNEHERRFGNGLLAEERIAARVQALCALGRFAEADVQLARLSHGSLHGQPTRQACGSRKNN